MRAGGFSCHLGPSHLKDLLVPVRVVINHRLIPTIPGGYLNEVRPTGNTASSSLPSFRVLPRQHSFPARETREASERIVVMGLHRRGNTTIVSESKDLWRRFRHDLELGAESRVHPCGDGPSQRWFTG